jgi:hypothetical protein
LEVNNYVVKSNRDMHFIFGAILNSAIDGSWYLTQKQLTNVLVPVAHCAELAQGSIRHLLEKGLPLGGWLLAASA